jgi:hypothetical protein
MKLAKNILANGKHGLERFTQIFWGLKTGDLNEIILHADCGIL